MAVRKEIDKLNAVAVFQAGLDELGSPITKSKVIAGLSKNSEVASVYDFVETVGSLQDLTLVSIESREYNTLIKE